MCILNVFVRVVLIFEYVYFVFVCFMCVCVCVCLEEGWGMRISPVWMMDVCEGLGPCVHACVFNSSYLDCGTYADLCASLSVGDVVVVEGQAGHSTPYSFPSLLWIPLFLVLSLSCVCT